MQMREGCGELPRKASRLSTAQIRTFVFLLVAIFITVSLTAQEPAARTKWSASWITHPTAPLREPIVLHFRKSFAMASVPAHFLVHASGDNRFILYLNGERVGDGPARGDLALSLIHI